MVSFAAERHIRLPALRARWLNQTFLHWPYPPEQVQALLPPGVRADLYEGAAWVSLTPFLMADVRPLGIPSVPGFGTFPETNLRTYVRGPDGRDGLWFLTAQVGAGALLAARAIGVPYTLARLGVSADGDRLTYTGSRGGGEPSYRLVVRTGAPLAQSDLDIWLTGRWRAFSRGPGDRMWETPVSHEPWSLSGGTVEELRETLTAVAELPAPGGEPLVHVCGSVEHVRLGVSRPVR